MVNTVYHDYAELDLTDPVDAAEKKFDQMQAANEVLSGMIDTAKQSYIEMMEEDPHYMLAEMDATELRDFIAEIILADKDPEDQCDFGGCVRDAVWKQMNKIALVMAEREINDE